VIFPGSSHLRSILNDRQILMVLDDVWDVEHAEPFLGVNDHSCVLITTRRAYIANELDVPAELYSLDLMSETQSLELVEKWLGRPILGEERTQAKQLIEALGYLPLALRLVAQRIKRGTSWIDLYTALEQEVPQIQKLEHPHKRTKGETKLEAVFNLSLNALKEDSIDLFTNFAWLGIVAEDVVIAAPMVATFWEVSVSVANERLEWLSDEALLLEGTEIFVDEKVWLGYRIHDLLHDIAGRILLSFQDSPAETLAPSHQELLNRYGKQLQKSELNSVPQWQTLPDDGYIHQHLTWHMEQTGQADAVHSLLQLETQEGRNAWHQRCDELGQPAIFITDVSRAWDLTVKALEEEALTADKRGQMIGLQCQYMLIMASLNTSASIPFDLLIMLLDDEVWTPIQALTYVKHIQDERYRAKVLTDLVKKLPETLLLEVFEASRQIQDEASRAKVLTALGEKLPEALCEALEAALQIQRELSRTEVLESLGEKLPETLLPQALEAVQQIRNEWRRARVLTALGEKFPEILPEALEAALQIQDERYRAKVLTGLVKKLPETLLPEALEAALQIQSEWSRAPVLTALVEKLPETLLPEALEAGQLLLHNLPRAEVLTALGEKLPQVLPQAFGAAPQIQDECSRAEALAPLMEKLPERLLSQALEAARQIQNEWYRLLVLIALGKRLPQALPEALEAALQLENEWSRAEALTALGKEFPEMLSQAFEAGRQIQNEWYQAQVLTTLGEKTPSQITISSP
jgi:hypothetical protein